MTDRELILGLTDVCGDLLFCGGEGDLVVAALFVDFVKALPATRIHPDDVAEAELPDPTQTAMCLEYVFSDRSSARHAEVVAEFFESVPSDVRARAWKKVHEAVTARGDLEDVTDVTELRAALEERVQNAS